jgi:hypothetical protein
MAYDPRNSRVVLFGGTDGSATLFDDTWVWDGSQWQQLATTGTPDGMLSPSLVYDDTRGTLIEQGGTDVWELDGTTWTRLDGASPLPSRFVQGSAFDPVSHGIVIQGGLPSSDMPLEDTWEWNGAWTYVATPTKPPARAEHAMFPNPDGAGVVTFGGRAGLFGPFSTNFNDTWRLAWASSTPRESCATVVDLDRDGLAGCADPDCWYACTPTCPPGSASCDSAAPKCGDGVCNVAREDCRSCPDDCPCGAAVCGDGYCDTSESPTSCPGDCTL